MLSQAITPTACSDSSPEWRKVKGWPYWVSSDGHVVNRHGHGIKPSIAYAGYARVCLQDGPRKKSEVVHKLVAEAFIGPRPEGHNINHRDGVKLNNSRENIEYTTPSENQRHAVAMGLSALGDRNGTHTHPEKVTRGEACGSSRLKEVEVMAIHLGIVSGVNDTDLAREYGVDRKTVARIRIGKTWSHLTGRNLAAQEPGASSREQGVGSDGHQTTANLCCFELA